MSQNEFQKSPTLSLVKPTQYEKFQSFFLEELFQQNSEFEISGLAISEKKLAVTTPWC